MSHWWATDQHFGTVDFDPILAASTCEKVVDYNSVHTHLGASPIELRGIGTPRDALLFFLHVPFRACALHVSTYELRDLAYKDPIEGAELDENVTGNLHTNKILIWHPLLKGENIVLYQGYRAEKETMPVK